MAASNSPASNFVVRGAPESSWSREGRAMGGDGGDGGEPRGEGHGGE